MARVSQFVLFVCIAIACSFSYTLPKDSQYDLELPPENQDLENEDYDSYIDNLIARLSPEEINILKNHHKINVDDRDGNSGNCNWTSKVIYPRRAIGTNDIILNSRTNELQPVDLQICNGQDNYSCKPATNDHHYYGCCIKKKEKRKMLVALINYKNNKDVGFVDPTTGTQINGIIEKEVYLNSLCACEDYAETADDLLQNIGKEERCKYKK